MQRSKRQKLIIQAVASGTRSVQALAELTGASAVSIRRDLVELAEQGAIRRTRGGAAPMPHRGATYPFSVRQGADQQAKAALAKAAADLIEPGESVFIDNGTTAIAVAVALAGRGVTGLAMSLHAAAALARKPGNQVLVPGGPVNPDDLAFTGAGAAEAVADMRFDTAIIGTCAISFESGLTVADWGDARIKRAAVAAARRVILVATPDKFDRSAAHRFAAISGVDVIITTTKTSSEVLDEAHGLGLRVIRVDCPD